MEVVAWGLGALHGNGQMSDGVSPNLHTPAAISLSTASGVPFQPSSEHFGSLVSSLQHSATVVTEPT